MLDKIIEIAKKMCEDQDIEFNEDTSILMDMEFSSMEFFAFVTEVEGQTGVHISERELNKIETLGDLAEIVEKKTK